MLKRMSLFALLLICFLSTATVCLANDDAREAIRRGNSKVAREQYEEAIKEYRRVQETSGELYATARYNIGVCNYELSRSDEAMAEYSAAIEARRGRYPKALYALGVVLEDLKRWGRKGLSASYRHFKRNLSGSLFPVRLGGFSDGELREGLIPVQGSHQAIERSFSGKPQ